MDKGKTKKFWILFLFLCISSVGCAIEKANDCVSTELASYKPTSIDDKETQTPKATIEPTIEPRVTVEPTDTSIPPTPTRVNFIKNINGEEVFVVDFGEIVNANPGMSVEDTFGNIRNELFLENKSLAEISFEQYEEGNDNNEYYLRIEQKPTSNEDFNGEGNNEHEISFTLPAKRKIKRIIVFYSFHKQDNYFKYDSIPPYETYLFFSCFCGGERVERGIKRIHFGPNVRSDLWDRLIDELNPSVVENYKKGEFVHWKESYYSFLSEPESNEKMEISLSEHYPINELSLSENYGLESHNLEVKTQYPTAYLDCGNQGGPIKIGVHFMNESGAEIRIYRIIVVYGEPYPPPDD